VLAQDDKLVRKVGAATIAVLTAVIALVVFVGGRIRWGARLHVIVTFHDTAGLAEGAPFVVAGRTVGKVETIGFGDARAGVRVTVVMPASDADMVDAAGDVFMASRGVLSAKYLELAPPREPTRAVKEGDVFVGKDPPTLDHVVQRTWDNLTTLGKFRDEVKPELDALTAHVEELRATAAGLPDSARFAELVGNAGDGWRELTDLRERGLGGDAGRAKLAATLEQARAVIAQGRAALDRLAPAAAELRGNVAALTAKLAARGDVIAKLAETIDVAKADFDKADTLMASVDELMAQIPDGSIAKLQSDPEFPEDTKELGKYLKRHPWKIVFKPGSN
jgi:ABC-type transporter Mla subunit MlaD